VGLFVPDFITGILHIGRRNGDRDDDLVRLEYVLALGRGAGGVEEFVERERALPPGAGDGGRGAQSNERGRQGRWADDHAFVSLGKDGVIAVLRSEEHT